VLFASEKKQMKFVQKRKKLIVAAGHHLMETPEGDYVMAYALPEK